MLADPPYSSAMSVSVSTEYCMLAWLAGFQICPPRLTEDEVGQEATWAWSLAGVPSLGVMGFVYHKAIYVFASGVVRPLPPQNCACVSTPEQVNVPLPCVPLHVPGPGISQFLV